MKIPNFAKIALNLFGNVTRTEHLLLQDYKARKGHPITRKTKLEILKDTGVVVMGRKTSRQKRYMINVPFKAKVKAGSLLLMGTNSQLNNFEKNARKK